MPNLIVGRSIPKADAARIHVVLSRVGIAPPQAEVDAQRVGAGTELALRKFQLRAGLAATGVLDDATRAAIDATAAAPNDGGGAGGAGAAGGAAAAEKPR